MLLSFYIIVTLYFSLFFLFVFVCLFVLFVFFGGGEGVKGCFGCYPFLFMPERLSVSLDAINRIKTSALFPLLPMGANFDKFVFKSTRDLNSINMAAKTWVTLL